MATRAPARSAAEFVPDRLTRRRLRAAASGCAACDLYKRATTVFGEGQAPARVMLVGEQPGHEEDHAGEISACRPWLEAEIAVVQPQVIVCLGATAAQALLGPRFRVTQERGRFVASPLAPYVLATVHPSAVLRAPDDETRHRETARFVEDLEVVASVL